MRLLTKLLLTLLFTGTAFAQSLPIRNDTPTALRDLGANLNVGANFAVDQYGQIRIGNITPGTGATSLGKAEDSVHNTGDVGVGCWAVQSATAGTFAGNGEYAPLSVSGINGGLFVEIASSTLATSPVRAEDVAIAAADAVVVVGAQREDALTTNTGTTGDATPLKTDGNGRLIITNTPPGESWQGCGTATASTADVAIKAAVASNRIYVTSITCASSDADNATNINFKDGSTVMAVGGVNQMATTSAGTFIAVFKTPLRGTANTAFNFNTAVSTSSVICCAAGYISVL